MANPKFDFSHLSPAERLELISELWDSLEPAEAAPISPELGAELDRRSAEAERDPESGRSWDAVKADLERRLK
ncbi:MAG: addiction module protein [Gemmatimonadales bacterium]